MLRPDDGFWISVMRDLFHNPGTPAASARRTFKYPLLDKPSNVWRFPDTKAKRGGRQSALSHRRARWLRELTDES